MNLNEFILKPAVSAGVTALTFRQLFTPEADISYFGRTVSVTMAGAAIGFISSVATEAATMFVLPHISKDRRLQHLESLALTVGTAAVVTWAIPRFLADGGDNSTPQVSQNFLIAGALSEVLSQWIYESFFTGEAALFSFS